jgi:hypothetical protein
MKYYQDRVCLWSALGTISQRSFISFLLPTSPILFFFPSMRISSSIYVRVCDCICVVLCCVVLCCVVLWILTFSLDSLYPKEYSWLKYVTEYDTINRLQIRQVHTLSPLIFLEYYKSLKLDWTPIFVVCFVLCGSKFDLRVVFFLRKTLDKFWKSFHWNANCFGKKEKISLFFT